MERHGVDARAFPSPVRPKRSIQQIPIEDVVEFASFVIGTRDGLLGEKIAIASDELSGSGAASISGVSSDAQSRSR